MEKVAIYTRVSTRRQVEKYSPKEQVRILTEFANSKEWGIYDYYSDLGESGSDSDREELDRLMVDAEKKHFNRVLLFEQDRLSRLEQIEWAYLANNLAKLDIKLVTPTSEINLDNEEDRFLADLFNLLANRELKKTKKRTSMGRMAAHRSGKYFGREAPYGISYNSETNTFKVIPEEASIVKKMHELYRGGESFNSIARLLNGQGYRGRLSGRFTSSQVRKTMLNSIHSGYFTQTILGETMTHTVNWEEGSGPYVAKDDYEILKKIANERSLGKPQYFHSPKYLLVGLLICSECNKKMSLLINESKLASGEMKKYYYYAHRNALKTCRYRYDMKKVNDAVILKLAEVAGNPEALMKSMKNNNLSESKESLISAIESIASERKRIVARKNKLLDLYMDGGWTKTELEDKKTELNYSLDGLTKREDEINKKLVAISSSEIDYESVALNFLIFKDFGKILSNEEQIELLRKFINKVRISKSGELQIYLYENNGKFICAKYI